MLTAKASAAPGRKLTSQLFEHWIMAGGDATKTKVDLQIKKTEKASSLDKDGWLTQSQIARHYNLPTDCE
jgi:hypothetical protein